MRKKDVLLVSSRNLLLSIQNVFLGNFCHVNLKTLLIMIQCSAVVMKTAPSHTVFNIVELSLAVVLHTLLLMITVLKVTLSEDVLQT